MLITPSPPWALQCCRQWACLLFEPNPWVANRDLGQFFGCGWEWSTGL